MPYSKGPYTLHSSLPVPDRPTVCSARYIDFATARYVMDEDGSFEQMPPIDQRVVILAGRAINRAIGDKSTAFNTIQTRNKIRREIRNELQILTAYPTPLAVIKEILVGSEFAGGARAQVTYTDLTKGTGIDQKVQIP